MNEKKIHKAGYVGIIGKPNVGKSTLMNALLGQKLSITTNKPQTTRKNILGILSEEDYQLIFLDTPGILTPKYLLQKKMEEQINFAAADADLLAVLFDGGGEKPSNLKLIDENLKELLGKLDKPIIALLNKIDIMEMDRQEGYVNELEESGLFLTVLPVSALNGHNLDKFTTLMLEHLPEHPKYYPNDIIASEHERFFVSEIIREQVFELYKEEIPYSTEVMIEEFKEREVGKNYIRAVVIVERPSQKSILIGKKGAAIKKLGEAARTQIEKFLDRKVFLELHVKVKEKWRSDENLLKSLGYHSPE